jgi:hypothetical protein
MISTALAIFVPLLAFAYVAVALAVAVMLVIEARGSGGPARIQRITERMGMGTTGIVLGWPRIFVVAVREWRAGER